MGHSGDNQAKRRVLIIGGGIAGAATAWALSQCGEFECTVLEKEQQLGAHSTSKNASILRTLTGSWATTQLALETAAFLQSPPVGFAEAALLDEVGLILIPEGIAARNVQLWRERKAPGAVQDLEREQLRQLLPHWEGCSEGALWIRDEGHIDTSALFDGLVRGAKQRGARFVLGARVEGLLRDGSQLRAVELHNGEHLDADLVVIAGGGWAAELGRRAGSELPLEARRRHLMVTAPEERIDRAWPILWSEPDNYYVRPESGGLMLCACDQDVVDPEHCTVRPEVLEQVAQRTAHCMPGFADARCAHFWSGMRTFAPDPEFVIGFDGNVRNLFWVAGLGGHGMSTSVGVGRLAAQLIRGEGAPDNLAQAFDPRRMGAGATHAPQTLPEESPRRRGLSRS